MLRALSVNVIIVTMLFLCSCGNTSTFFTPTPYLTETGQGGVVGIATGAAVGAYTGGGLGAGVGALAGGIIGTTVGHFLEQNQSQLSRLRQQGVQVVAVGDNVLLILPSDKFFYFGSPHRAHVSDPALDDIANLLAQYDKVTVKVAAYTDNRLPSRMADALTQQQAQTIADYLWARGIDTRILYIAGYGARFPIANNLTPRGQAQNRRIEITLRLLPGCCHLAMGTDGIRTS